MTALVRQRPWTAAQAQRVLSALAASGETTTGFAKRHGLVPQRLSWWQQRLGEPQVPNQGS